MANAEQKFCTECKKVLRIEEFYGSNNLEKYPDGKLNQCKKCATRHVDNWEPDTFLPILEECDVPYIPKAWNQLLKKYGQDPTKVTGVTIVGRYLSNMKMKQYKDYRWKDSEYLQQLEDLEIEQAMKRQGLGAAEIDQVVRDSKKIIENPNPYSEQEPQEDYFAQIYDDDFDNNLTEEDCTFLRLKWGKMYKPEEWVNLEQLYQEMTQSYDIQSAGDINSLKLACKTSLKANQLLDLGDRP